MVLGVVSLLGVAGLLGDVLLLLTRAVGGHGDEALGGQVDILEYVDVELAWPSVATPVQMTKAVGSLFRRPPPCRALMKKTLIWLHQVMLTTSVVPRIEFSLHRQNASRL